jgi:hypothetical protein
MLNPPWMRTTTRPQEISWRASNSNCWKWNIIAGIAPAERIWHFARRRTCSTGCGAESDRSGAATLDKMHWYCQNTNISRKGNPQNKAEHCGIVLISDAGSNADPEFSPRYPTPLHPLLISPMPGTNAERRMCGEVCGGVYILILPAV